MALIALSQRRTQSPPHQPQPEYEANEQKNLPQPAKIHVLITLCAQPEPEVSELVLDTHPFASQRPDDNQQQRAEESIHAKPLSFRLVAANCRGHIQSCSQPRSSNPENSNLKMPCSGDRVRKPAVKWDAIKPRTFDSVVRCDRS